MEPIPPIRQVAVVFNGSKSRQRLQAFCAAARTLLAPGGGRLTVYEATSSAHVTQCAALAVEDGHDVLIVAGGDGTLFHLLRGLPPARRDDIVIGLLPLGTSNDFARAVGIRDDAAALASLRGGCVRRVDLNSCAYVTTTGDPAEDVFCLSGGVGFTAAIAQSEASAVMRTLKKVLRDGAFVLSSVRQIVDFRGAPARLKLDERTLDTTLSLLEVTKVPALGGMPLTPNARVDSGTLELCLFHDTSRWRRVQLLLSLQFSSRHVYWPDVEYVSDQFDPAFNRVGATRVHEITVETDPALPLHLHGEVVGVVPAVFKVESQGLRVLAATSESATSANHR